MNTDCTKLPQLLRLEMRDNGKKYLMWIGIIFISLASITCFTTIQNYDAYAYAWRQQHMSDPMSGFMEAFFWVGFVCASCVYASQVFAPLSSKGGVISSLMLPATQFDKYIARWLLFVPAFIIVYILCFELVDLLRYVALYYKLPSREALQLTGFSFMPSQLIERGMSIALPLLLSSFFVLGSAIWPKRAFIYTALCLAALVAVCSICSNIYFAVLLSGPDTPNALRHGNIDGDALGWTVFALAVIGIFVNYTLAYFRFKETEIIQRW